MKKLFFTFSFLLITLDVFSVVVEKNKINYMYMKDGYLQEVTNKNSALMYESVRRGVEVFNQKDLGKPDSYRNNAEYPPPELYKSKEEIQQYNEDLKKYNKLLDEYYYEILNKLNEMQTKLYKQNNKSELFKEKLSAVERIFELVSEAKNSDFLEIKEEVVKITQSYQKLKISDSNYAVKLNKLVDSISPDLK